VLSSKSINGKARLGNGLRFSIQHVTAQPGAKREHYLRMFEARRSWDFECNDTREAVHRLAANVCNGAHVSLEDSWWLGTTMNSIST
jgi:hypothetical protein